MSWRRFSSLNLLLFCCFSSLASAAEDPNEIVRKADAIRAPSGSYTFEAVVTSFDGEKQRGVNSYVVYVKDLDHTLLEFRSPASEKGKSMLMLQDDVWIYLPNVRKPIRVPLKQRLLGEVAIGDMTRANFFHDYDATLVGEEELEGKPTYVLDLKAKSPTKTYNQVKYWVAKSNYHPVQAEYFTVSGKSLKKAVWQDFEIQAGAVRPTKLFYQDSLNKNKISHLNFDNMIQKKLDDRLFTKQHMQTFE